MRIPASMSEKESPIMTLFSGLGASEVGEGMLEQADLRLAAMAVSNVMRTPLPRRSPGHFLQRGLEANRSYDRAVRPWSLRHCVPAYAEAHARADLVCMRQTFRLVMRHTGSQP